MTRVKSASKPRSEDVLSIMGMAMLSILIPIGSPEVRIEYPHPVMRNPVRSMAIPMMINFLYFKVMILSSSAFNLAPHTLHHIPYTLYLTPYTVYLIPYTVHLTPYTLHRIPFTFYTLRLAPCAVRRASCSYMTTLTSLSLTTITFLICFSPTNSLILSSLRASLSISFWSSEAGTSTLLLTLPLT